jgi:hypothetical protein
MSTLSPASATLSADLVLTLRGLLAEHRLQPSGDCQICTSVWPCPVVITIHAIVKDPERQFVAILRARSDDLLPAAAGPLNPQLRS